MEETVLESEAINEGSGYLGLYSVFIIIPIGIIGFFTWKLIKSLREKEKKKEEKKKLKSQRKDVKKKK